MDGWWQAFLFYFLFLYTACCWWYRLIIIISESEIEGLEQRKPLDFQVPAYKSMPKHKMYKGSFFFPHENVAPWLACAFPASKVRINHNAELKTELVSCRDNLITEFALLCKTHMISSANWAWSGCGVHCLAGLFCGTLMTGSLFWPLRIHHSVSEAGHFLPSS